MLNDGAKPLIERKDAFSALTLQGSKYEATDIDGHCACHHMDTGCHILRYLAFLSVFFYIVVCGDL